jgi:hypothetical protein
MLSLIFLGRARRIILSQCLNHVTDRFTPTKEDGKIMIRCYNQPGGKSINKYFH